MNARIINKPIYTWTSLLTSQPYL